MDENKNEVSIIKDETIEKEELKLSIKTQLKNKRNRTRFITRCGMFSALSFVLYILKFPLPFFPPFLEVNFSNLAIVIGALSLGPIGGEIIVVARFILKILFAPGATMLVGEFTDFLLSSCIMLPASIYYMYNHNRKGGTIGIALSFVSWIVFSILINWLVSLPLYDIVLSKGGKSLLDMLASSIDGLNESNYVVMYLFGAILPFNLLVGGVSSLITLFTYKKVSTLLKKMGL